MSDEREALAKLVDPVAWSDVPCDDEPMREDFRRQSLEVAEDILAAGWRPSQPAPAEPCRHPLDIRRRQYSGIYCGGCGAGPLPEATIQPAPADDEVIARARRLIALFKTEPPEQNWCSDALFFARALLAERAAREAAERERDEARKDMRDMEAAWRQHDIAREAAEAEVARLREAVTAAIDAFSLVERPAFKDPEHWAAVEALGREIGYGALMSSASASWREGLGRLAGGEYVAGPCHSTVIATLDKLRAALAPAAPEAEHGC